MKYFQDITLLPGGDIALGFLWEKIFQQVHIALVEQKVDDRHSAIAVSFPGYGSKGFPLGSKLRVLADEKSQLGRLNLGEFLARFEDYVHIKSIQSVPDGATPVAFLRRHVKGRRRLETDMRTKAELWAKKSGKPLEECLQSLAKTKPKAQCNTPFIRVQSQQTKGANPHHSAPFLLFIERVEVAEAKAGLFNCYGLSAAGGSDATTVPHF